MWYYHVNLSFNLIDRIPNLMEMLLYSCIRVITNSPNLLISSPILDYQLSYLKFFKVKSLYYSEDIMNKYFKNDYFGYLLINNLRINYNYDNYLFQETFDVFTNTKIWEKKLNSNGYFCIYTGLGEFLFYQKPLTSYEIIKNSESSGLKCLNKGNDINESGVKLEINYVLQEITNNYIEFINRINSNTSLEEAQKKFFNSTKIKRVFNDIYYPFVQYYHSIIHPIDSDFLSLNYYFNDYQIKINLILFFANLCILTCISFTFLQIERQKNLFGFFAEILKEH